MLLLEAVKSGFWSEFWEFKFSDAISTLSVVVALIVYIYQRKKDASDTVRQQAEAGRIARQQWIWLMLLEPNRAYVLGFFTRLEHALASMNHAKVRTEERTKARLEVESLLNEFERKFLSYFDGIDTGLASEYEELFDTLRTDLTRGLATFTDTNYFIEHKQLVSLVLRARSSFLSKLYTYSFATA